MIVIIRLWLHFVFSKLIIRSLRGRPGLATEEIGPPQRLIAVHKIKVLETSDTISITPFIARQW